MAGLWKALRRTGLLPSFLILILLRSAFPQQRPYERVAETIIDTALAEGKAYAMLAELAKGIGPRLSGSPQAAEAVEWARQVMLNIGLDSVFLQPVIVPHWVRGRVESAAVLNSPTVGTVPLAVCALGGSVSTPELGLASEVLEVKSLEEVRRLGNAARGKIVFYNRPMDRKVRKTFVAYGKAVDQRVMGAVEAARMGAIAVLVRSMTTRLDKIPHTGGMRYKEGVPRIPAAAISTLDADFLSKLLHRDGRVRVRLQLDCHTLDDVLSANVIGEIRGRQMPREVVLLGAHLDSWDKGQGAHDDAAGCVLVIEALRLIKSLKLTPRRTIRGVLFMNEENGLRGGRAYADSIARSGITHVAAIESDRGGFTPRGFSIDAPDSLFERIRRWTYLFEEIEATRFYHGGGGADISPLKRHGIPLLGLMVDSQRYFDYHHSDNDTFDKVNERELELGAAAIAILAYVLAMEGL